MVVRRSKLAIVCLWFALAGCQCPGGGAAQPAQRRVTAEEIAVLREIETLREGIYRDLESLKAVGRASSEAIELAKIALLEARLARIRAEAAAGN